MEFGSLSRHQSKSYCSIPLSSHQIYQILIDGSSLVHCGQELIVNRTL